MAGTPGWSETEFLRHRVAALEAELRALKARADAASGGADGEPGNSAQRYAAAFANEPTGVARCRVITDGTGQPADYQYLDVTKGYELVTGRTRADVVGKTVREVFPGIEHARDGYIARFGRVGLEGGELNTETHFDGRWYSVYVYSPAPGEFVLVCRDITQRKEAAKAVVEQQEQLMSFIENAPVAIAMFDRSMRFLTVSRRMSADYGLGEPSGLIGRSEYDVFPEMPEHWKEVHRRVLVEGERISCDEDEFPRDGRTLYVRWVMHPWYAGTGEIGGAILFAENITGQVETRRAKAVADQRAAETLRESEERFRSTFENAAVGIAHVKLDGGFLRMNDRMCEILGYARQELMPLSFENITHPDDIEAGWRAIRALRAGEIAHFKMEKRYIRKDGRAVWSTLTLSLLRDAAGQPLHFIAIVEDISERKRAENALRVSEETLLTFFNSTSMLMGVVEISGDDILHICDNLAAQSYYRSNTEGRWASELGTTAERIRLLLGYFRQAQTTRGTVRFEVPIDPRAGRGTISISAAFIHMSRTGRPRFSYIAEDITARKKIEEELERNQARLRESEARFRGLVEAAPSVLFITEREGLNEFVSPAWMRVTGLTQEESSGWGWISAVHAEDADEARDRWMQSVATGQPFETEFRLRGQDGVYHWFISRAIPICDEEGRIVKWFGSATDIENQKRTELALRLANDDLNRFAFVAAHDLREPLRNIGAYSEMLVAQFQARNETKAARAQAVIQDGVERMDHLLADLLEYSQVTNMDAREETVDCNTALRKALENLRQTMEEAKASVSSGSLPEIPGHETQVVRIFQNLIGNGIKYRGSNSPRVSIAVARDDGQWVFRVRDNGMGIDPAFRDHIFGMFKRLHGREVPGTGIGLAICAKIIESRGGRIWVESQPGEGSEFLFTWPVKRSVPGAAKRQNGGSDAV